MIKTIMLETLFILGVPAVLLLVMRWLGVVLQQELLSRGRFIWILAPGTIIHELSHLIVCLLFGLPVRKVSLFHYEPETGTLGHVDYAYNPLSMKDRIGASLSGLAPLVGISALEYFIYSKLFPANVSYLIADIKSNQYWQFIKDFFLNTHSWLHMLLFIGISILLLSGYSLSDADLNSIKVGVVAIIVLIVGLLLLSQVLPFISATLFLGVKMLIAFSAVMMILSVICIGVLKVV